MELAGDQQRLLPFQLSKVFNQAGSSLEGIAGLPLPQFLLGLDRKANILLCFCENGSYHRLTLLPDTCGVVQPLHHTHHANYVLDSGAGCSVSGLGDEALY